MDKYPPSALPDSETAVAHHPAEKPTLPNLDGIRATACLMVLLSHMPWPVHFETLGETGVGLFFVLSGFLMGYLHAETPWNYQSVCRYSIARFARIAPIYWLVISVCVAISYYDPGSDFILKILGETAVARHYLFGGNVSIFWSIPLEIQFYVFFLLFWFAVATRSKQPVVLPLVILLCAGLLLTHNLWPGLMLPNKLHFFLAGAIAGLVPRSSWEKVVDRRYLVYLQAAALALVLLPIWLYDSKPEFYKATELGIALAVAIYLLAIPSGWTTALFAAPLMRRIGQASFSIYLIHMLVFQYGAGLLGLSMDHYGALWPVLAVFGVVLPMFVSRLVEIPLQRVTRRALVGLLVGRKLRPSVALNA
jgi:peptidoglycan/LPS O-acetylase OafA/YrhL